MSVKRLAINQIFKGWSPSQYFGSEGTYNSSVAIDPDLPIVSTDIRTSGFPVPVGSAALTTTNVTGAVVREITHPKDNLLWTVQTNGKIVTFKSDLTGERLIGTVAGSNATWAEYYNNYIYVFGTGASKDDVSRIGPLNTLPYDAQTGNFTVGLTVTGATSGATGIITGDVDAGVTGTLTLSSINGHFIDNEVITDTSTGSATVNRTDASLIVDNVWKGATLGTQTALTNTKYPTFRSMDMPNHVAHVHGDGSLYFCDFKDGQGLIHRINTKKVTNEGDTNGTTAPSLYNALDLPFGFYPTSIESDNTDLFITGIYQTDTTTNQGHSAWIIWDPTNTTSFKAGPVYFSDPIASACLNVNGNIFIWTGNAQNGVRLSKYIGGLSVQEVVFQEEGLPPFAGAVDALGNRVVWGGFTSYPSLGATVWGWGSKRADLPAGLHNVMSTTASTISIADSYSESNFTSYKVMSGSTSAGVLTGQSFTGDGSAITSAVFFLRKNISAAMTGAVEARIYAHTGVFGTSSGITGSALATSTSINVTDLTTAAGQRTEFTFNTPYTTTNGTKYCVVLAQTSDIGGGTLQIAYDGTAPTHGGNIVYFDNTSGNVPDSTGDICFYVYSNATTYNVTALKYVQQNSNVTPKTVISWKTASSQGIDQYSTTATLKSKIRWIFSVGSKFSIKRLSIPLAGAVGTNTNITPTLYFDDLSSNKTLTAINNTNYSGRRKVTYKGTGLKDATGYNNFMLELAWTGTDPLPASLPILIDVDILEDEP